MKTTLIFIFLNVFCLQQMVFATIQKTPIATVLPKTPTKLSFKQRVITALLQRKIQHFVAQSASKDSADRNCVKIVLKTGLVIIAQINSMDDKNITYKLCEQSNSIIGTVALEKVSRISDTNDRIIFNNEAKLVTNVNQIKGRRNANISISALLIAAAALILTIIAIASSFGNGSSFVSSEIFGIISVLTFVVGILVSFIAGLLALTQLGKSTPENSTHKFLASISMIVSGLVLFLAILSSING